MQQLILLVSSRDRRHRLQPWLDGILLGLVLALLLCLQSSTAQAPAYEFAMGDFSAVSVDAVPQGETAITAPSSLAFGALLYDPDFKRLEEQARLKLKRGLDVRQAMSPYQGNLEFSAYVTKFDYQAGWSRNYTGTTPYSETLTLMGLIDKADQDLRDARDMYAYLTVYAPEYRFRADAGYITTTLPGHPAPLCGATDKEDPDPADPANSGLVLDPVIDWCNFTARLRQSVREAAYLRMIFGQQFMADALGLQFSGTELLGADNAVRQEVARLRAAKHQYEEAERGLAEALDRNLGSGCYVSDFYQQSEWSLLSRAVEGQETAQHHIAIRQSYLDVPQTTDGIRQARDAGVKALREASVDGYIKLIGMAGLGAGQPTGLGCAKGARPDGALVAEMAVNLLETRRKSREMDDGRNVFGFDVTFTPARFFRSSTAMDCATNVEGRGLWDEAWCAAELAQSLEATEIAATKDYNNAQDKLQTEVLKVQAEIDGQIKAKSGCSNSGNDEQWFACVDQQIARLNACFRVITSTATLNSAFDTCMASSGILDSDAQRALFDLRGVRLQMQGIYSQAMNINQRIQLSNGRNATVTEWLLKRGGVETAARCSQSALDMMQCVSAGNDLSPTEWGNNAACYAIGAVNIALQSAAGGVSTAADIEIEDAEHNQEVGNLLLDQTELLIDYYAADQQYRSKLSEVKSLLDSLPDDVREARRQRAYFEHSPANDPSFRIVRDSARLQLAKQMEKAGRFSYLAARRAEYEFATRLNASNLRISDIYRARTAADLTTYLDTLRAETDMLAGSTAYETDPMNRTISVARHVFNWTDANLALDGFTAPGAAQAERTKRFRAWVAKNVVSNTFESPYDGKPVLRFSFETSLLPQTSSTAGGLFSHVIQQGYDGYWLIKLAGVGQPKTENTGLSINLVTDQTGLSMQQARLAQGGTLHLRAANGCIYDYRLMAPAWLLGLEWAQNQTPEATTASFWANVNGVNQYSTGFRTSAFLGRAASSTNWQVMVFSGYITGTTDMDLKQLTDIELNFSTTTAHRDPAQGEPPPSQCTRIDW